MIEKAICICDCDFTGVIGEFHINGFVRDRARKLREVDPDLHFGCFVLPAELLNLLFLNFIRPLLLPLPCIIRFGEASRLNQDGVAAINFAVAFEMLRSLSGKVLGGVRVIIRIASLLLDVV